MHGNLWHALKDQVVIEVPEALFACLDCDFVECSESKFQDCPNRLAIAAMLQAMAEAKPLSEGG